MEILKFKDGGKYYVPRPKYMNEPSNACEGCQVGSEACAELSRMGSCLDCVYVMLTKHKVKEAKTIIEKITVHFDKDELKILEKKFGFFLGDFFHEVDSTPHANVKGVLYEKVEMK